MRYSDFRTIKEDCDASPATDSCGTTTSSDIATLVTPLAFPVIQRMPRKKKKKAKPL